MRAVGAKLERHVADLPDDDRRRLANAYPCHGDLSPQNFLVDGNGAIYALDMEGFSRRPLDIDLATFRMRLEHHVLRGVFGRGRALAIWQRFLDVYLGSGTTPAFALVAYLHKMLAHMAWMRHPRFLAAGGARQPLTTQVRTRLWIRGRLAWLRRLPADLRQAADYLHRRL